MEILPNSVVDQIDADLWRQCKPKLRKWISCSKQARAVIAANGQVVVADFMEQCEKEMEQLLSG